MSIYIHICTHIYIYIYIYAYIYSRHEHTCHTLNVCGCEGKYTWYYACSQYTKYVIHTIHMTHTLHVTQTWDTPQVCEEIYTWFYISWRKIFSMPRMCSCVRKCMCYTCSQYTIPVTHTYMWHILHMWRMSELHRMCARDCIHNSIRIDAKNILCHECVCERENVCMIHYMVAVYHT